GSALPIVTGSAAQADPAIAGTTDRWLVFWSDGAQIKLSTVTMGGAVGSPSTVANGAHASAAFDGTSGLVAYEQGSPRAIIGTWVGADGTLTSNRPTIAAGTLDLDSPSVAAGGGKAIVAWHEPTTNNETIRMAGLTTNQAGTPVGIPVASLAGRRDAA